LEVKLQHSFVVCVDVQKQNKTRRIPYVEKIQLILKLQCDALIKLGFDESVKVNMGEWEKNHQQLAGKILLSTLKVDVELSL